MVIAASTGALGLLRLPDELLLNIAARIDGPGRQKSLSNLALTSQRLRLIAREALHYKLTIQMDHVRELVARLFLHPQLATKVNTIVIVKHDIPPSKNILPWWSARKPTRKGPNDFAPPSDSALSLAAKCGAIISAQGLSDPSWKWTAGLQQGDPYAFLAILFILTPNLQVLSLPDSIAAEFHSKPVPGQGRRPYRPYMNQFLAIAPMKLRSFIIWPLRNDTLYGALAKLDLLKLETNTTLKTLHISFKNLKDPGPKAADESPTEGIPSSVETIRIFECDVSVTLFLEHLWRRKSYFPCLIRVELQGCWTTLMGESSSKGKALKQVAKRCKEIGIKVQFAFKLKWDIHPKNFLI